MAERPIFVPSIDGPELVNEISCQLRWHTGFAPIQKKKNIKALHEAAANAGFSPLLEVSTKSDDALGQHLSAFHLKVHHSTAGEITLECAFQGSKVFEGGGPYTDMYRMDPKSAKRDHRLHNSGRLIAFRFEDFNFPLEPKTVFYDWLYVNAIFPHRDWLKRLYQYAGFTDIEFNPERSINCQSRSCALFVALNRKDLLLEAVRSPQSFIRITTPHEIAPHSSPEKIQRPLFN